MSNVIRKQYYQITFELASPINVGSGYNSETDKDIIRNSNEEPYIPGSAIAGVSRDAVKGMGEDIIKKYFGDVCISGKTCNEIDRDKSISSKVVFYDALISSGKSYISVRDSVALDDFKTARKGAKFDMEVLEPGITFVTYIEQNISKDDEDIAYKVVQYWLNNQIRLGAKTTRGYGEIKTISVLSKSFELTDTDCVNRWLDFDMYSDWEDYETVDIEKMESKTISLSLVQRGGISIRKYTTKVNDLSDGIAVPDMEQLTLYTDDNSAKPVIPGSTWAGAFRHRMKELGCEDSLLYDLFGYVDDKKSVKKKSSIIFSETVISGANEKVFTRNAIDRFTGGAKNKALFTDKTYYGGKTKLVIRFNDIDKIKKCAGYIAATITDLDYGFLSIGGLTSVGRGLFEVTCINGKSVDDNTLYDEVLKALK